MFKKMLLVAVVAAVAVVGIKSMKGTNLPAQIKDHVGRWADAEDRSVEGKIAKLRRDAESMTKDLDKVRSQLATAIVNARDTGRDVTALRDRLAAEHRDLVARGERLKTEPVSTAAAVAAKERLKADVAAHVARKDRLAGMEATLATYERIRTTLEGQMEALKRKQGEVTEEINRAEAKFRELQLQQMESKYQQDDTRLAKIKAELRALNKSLDVRAEELKLAPVVHDDARPAAAAVAAGETVDQILAPLAPAAPAAPAKPVDADEID
jgi:chromosome segregation ATPase